ncbi:neuronal calcium sensor 2-like [Tubulanus polymorphus]|uniref:neuronal calcium sensor 2-like n=1 Tax=Tubulanus polymorphus TaxID=672921 RepID=UPI003DA53548
MGNKIGKKQAKIPDEDLDFLATKTNFSRKQIKDWYKAFTRDCPEGEITRGKFLEIYAQLFPDGKAKSFYNHLFRTFDVDNSGKIDFKEFLLAISITQDGKPEEKLDLAFRLYDIDRNGAIEEEEMSEIIKAIYLMVDDEGEIQSDLPPDNRARSIFQKMDTNSDGVLTKEEFIKGCMNDISLYNMLTGTNSEDKIENGDEGNEDENSEGEYSCGD